jgi:hypothetical protein
MSSVSPALIAAAAVPSELAASPGIGLSSTVSDTAPPAAAVFSLPRSG